MTGYKINSNTKMGNDKNKHSEGAALQQDWFKQRAANTSEENAITYSIC
jgi:hypothetical protein